MELLNSQLAQTSVIWYRGRCNCNHLMLLTCHVQSTAIKIENELIRKKFSNFPLGLQLWESKRSTFDRILSTLQDVSIELMIYFCRA